MTYFLVSLTKKFWSNVSENVVKSNITSTYNNKFDYKTNTDTVFQSYSVHFSGNC